MSPLGAWPSFGWDKNMKRLVSSVSVVLAWASLGLVGAAAAADAEMLARGKSLFTSEAVPACAICHTLADAEAEGAIGPDLDELRPDKDVVLKVLNEGMGAMPSFSETMSEDDMQAVAEYVVSVTSSGK